MFENFAEIFGTSLNLSELRKLSGGRSTIQKFQRTFKEFGELPRNPANTGNSPKMRAVSGMYLIYSGKLTEAKRPPEMDTRQSLPFPRRI